MLSVSEATERILSFFSPVEAEALPLAKAGGHILAADVAAGTDLPPFDNSSVDGFAVHSGETHGASTDSPRSFKVVADIRAGSAPSVSLNIGEAARIMTGAPLPAGADAVVMVEDTDFNDRSTGSKPPASVKVVKPVRAGENVRHHGDDLKTGEKVLSKGMRLRPQELGLLAMLGEAEVQVHRRPRLALLSSGDELLTIEKPLVPGRIHDSNSYILAALAEKAGAEVIILGIALDDRKDILKRLERAVSEKADLIVSSAGVSVGAFDYIKTIVESAGELDFWKVDLRPGKPLAFGKFHDIPFFGLPGNPVSAYVGFEIFIHPALMKLSGQKVRPHLTQKARLAEPVESDGRESYLRAIVTEESGRYIARLTGHQGSGNIFSLVQANALLIVPSGVKSLPANADVEVWFLE